MIIIPPSNTPFITTPTELFEKMHLHFEEKVWPDDIPCGVLVYGRTIISRGNTAVILPSQATLVAEIKP